MAKIVRTVILTALLSLLLMGGWSLPAMAQTPIYGGMKGLVGVEVQEVVRRGESIPIRIDVPSGNPNGYPYTETSGGQSRTYDAWVKVIICDPQNEAIQQWELKLVTDDINSDGWDMLDIDYFGKVWQASQDGRPGLYTIHIILRVRITTKWDDEVVDVSESTYSSMDSFEVPFVDGDFLLEINVQDAATPGQTIPIRIIPTQTSYPLPRVSTEEGYAVSINMVTNVVYPDGTVAQEWILTKWWTGGHLISTFDYAVGQLIMLDYQIPSDAPSGSYTAYVSGEVLFSLEYPEGNWEIVDRQYMNAKDVFEVTETTTIIMGDISGDGNITAFDASLILQSVVGLVDAEDYLNLTVEIADVTGDNTITALDAALILQYTVGLITQFPAQEGPILIAKDENQLLNRIVAELEDSPLSTEQKHVLGQLRHLLWQRVLPKQTALLQNYPNPFNPDTWLPFQLAQDASVTISIYNVKGQLIHMLHLGNQKAGIYVAKDKAVYWDGKDSFGEKVVSGIYFYTLQAGEFRVTKKMVIMK